MAAVVSEHNVGLGLLVLLLLIHSVASYDDIPHNINININDICSDVEETVKELASELAELKSLVLASWPTPVVSGNMFCFIPHSLPLIQYCVAVCDQSS